MLKARIRPSLCCWCAPVPVQTLPLLFCLLFISQRGKENKKSPFATSYASALQLHLQKFSGSQRTMDASPSGVCSSNFPALFTDNTCCLKPSQHHDSIVTTTASSPRRSSESMISLHPCCFKTCVSLSKCYKLSCRVYLTLQFRR